MNIARNLLHAKQSTIDVLKIASKEQFKKQQNQLINQKIYKFPKGFAIEN